MQTRQAAPTDDHATDAADADAAGRATGHRRPKPPMRVVTKGWLTREERTIDIEELQREREHAGG
jgi:hypothetical protein